MGLEHDLDFSFVQFIKDVTNCLPICYIPLLTDVPRNSTGMYMDHSLGNFFRDDFVWVWIKTEFLFFERKPKPFLIMCSTFM